MTWAEKMQPMSYTLIFSDDMVQAAPSYMLPHIQFDWLFSNSLCANITLRNLT